MVGGNALSKNSYGYYDIARGTSEISFVAQHTATYAPSANYSDSQSIITEFLEATPFTLSECTFTREGCEFAGWHDGNAIYEAGASYTAHSDVLFVPVWKNILATRAYYSEDGKADTDGDGIADIINATVTPSLIGSSASNGTTGIMNIYSGTASEITCIASGSSASATCDSVYNIYGGTIGNIFGVSRYTGASTSVVHTLNGNNTYNIYGGDFTGIIATSYKMGSVLNGILTFNISGGKFAPGKYFRFGGTQWSPKVEINGAMNFIINNKEIAQNGGTLDGIDIGSKANTLTKYTNLIIVMNNAEYAEQTGAAVSQNSIATHTLYVTGGKAAPKFDDNNALVGFEIVSDSEGYTPSINGTPLHKNAHGNYDISAGITHISFVQEVDYTTNGTVIEFYKDCELDITELSHSEKDGKLFIGWTFEDGTAPESTSFKAGDLLYAQYIDFDADKDFFIEGAQIRFANENSGITEGLRFVINRSCVSDALDIKEYGSVIVPSLAAGKNSVEIGKVFTYDSKEYAVMKVPAKKILARYDGYEHYTVCIVNISDVHYARLFSVRGYIEYTDLNGKDNVIYTDYYATNFLNIAQAVLDDKGVTDGEIRNRCEQVISTEKQRVKNKYNGLEKIALSNNYPDESQRAQVSTDFMYSLGENGVSVREVLIETNSENKEAVEIFQLTDLHFNYCNDEDFEEANPSILASYAGRQWLKDGASVPNAVAALEYASQGDATVITGDVIDFMSRGAVELTNKYIWDPYPNTLITFGNHDFERRCQDTPPTPDPTTYKSRYDYLQENWNHDVYYTSRVIKDKVMLIQLENGTTKFWDSQIEPLRRDIALARQNGYTVLIFYHIPLSTKNSEETNLLPIRRNDTFAYNFCDNGVGNARTTDNATLSVYDIITNNADIIKGTFCGHLHSDYKTEIIAKNSDGTDAVIPQWILTGNPYDGGHVLKITVK